MSMQYHNQLLFEENENLKQQVLMLAGDRDIMQYHNQLLFEENENLKQQVLMLANDRDMYIEEIKQFRTAAIFLFGLLDDIDTMDDVVKGDDVRYRNNVRNIHKRRFEIAETDGYNLTFIKKNKENV